MSFSQSSYQVKVNDFVEASINIVKPNMKNPFTEVFVTGHFKLAQANQMDEFVVDGFCDSADGSTYRVRFMPLEPGEYDYSITYWQDNQQRVFRGKFKAIRANRRGLVQVDPAYPWHFIWRGTGNTIFLTGLRLFC